MITSTISDTKNRLSELLVRVQSGETLIIVDRKTPVARVERIRGIADNPHVLPAMRKWNPEKILNLPILSAPKGSPSLVAAVHDEREGGW
ncbi:MAG: type II toxin-antitoxin system prevent-host-death family antitoxin [Terrimicrobiaceae bacterium]